MKLPKYIALLITYFLLISVAAAQNESHITYVEPKYQDIFKIITDAHDEIEGAFTENNVFVINVNKKNNVYEIKAGPINKNDFGWLLRHTKAIPYGFFKIKNITVIVFGDSAEVVFKKTQKTTIYDWLKPLPPIKDIDMIVNPIFEPPVWLYEFSKNEFRFIDVNRIELINKI